MDMHIPFSITELEYHAGPSPIIDKAVHVTHCEINDARGDFVTKVYDNPELARFIVTACNCHADLLEALKVALTSVEWMADATDADPEDAERLAFVKQAIRKAEETQ